MKMRFYCALVVVFALTGCAEDGSVLGPIHTVEPVGTIVFARGSDLCTVRPDGRDLRVLRSDVGRSSYNVGTEVRWSPDGQMIAYTSVAGLSIVDRKGVLHYQYDLPDAHWYLSNLLTGFSWSSDNQRLLFTTYYGLGAGLYLYRLSLDSLETIGQASNYAMLGDPVFSPNDREIAFVLHTQDFDFHVCVADTFGNILHVLAEGRSTGDERMRLRWLNDDTVIYRNRRVNTLFGVKRDGLSAAAELIVAPMDAFCVAQDQRSFAFTQYEYFVLFGRSSSTYNGQLIGERYHAPLESPNDIQLSPASDLLAFTSPNGLGLLWYGWARAQFIVTDACQGLDWTRVE